MYKNNSIFSEDLEEKTLFSQISIKCLVFYIGVIACRADLRIHELLHYPLHDVCTYMCILSKLAECFHVSMINPFKSLCIVTMTYSQLKSITSPHSAI